MKRKLKDFLNRRVISTAISAAITFNMAALFPVSVFAKDNSPNESNSKIVYYEGNRYQLFDESMSWTEAKEYCESIGGHLATITSAEEQAEIEKLISGGSKNSYWLGATDEVTDGKWVWVTGEEFSYENWSNGQPDNSYSGTEDYLGISRTNHGWANANEWNDFVVDSLSSDGGFICEWEGNTNNIEKVSPYTIFSGSSTENFQLNCWKSTFNGNIYSGASFVSNASELYLNGKVDAANLIITNGWKTNIDERNENVEKEVMPDWDERIHKMAGAYEYTEDNIVRIEDRNVVSGAVKTTGNVEISGTTFDGDCYIIADGDITYNVNDFISTGRVVLYSKSGNIILPSNANPPYPADIKSVCLRHRPHHTTVCFRPLP